MKITFLKPAEKELDDAVEYYESEQVGLGIRFQAEVPRSLSRIVRQPLSYQEIGKYSRRYLVHKFPYCVIFQYRIATEEILVVCIAHLHRRPDFWVSRELQK